MADGRSVRSAMGAVLQIPAPADSAERVCISAGNARSESQRRGTAAKRRENSRRAREDDARAM
jgi:hypothetical protein